MLTKPIDIFKNQSGAALVIALIMIIVMTLIVLAASFTSNFEIKLAGNKRGSTDAFYTADGGVQSIVANLANFNVPGNFTTVNPATLPTDLQSESINSKFSSPSFPAGVNFTDPPQVIIYHTTRTSAPRGLGFSATGQIEYEHYLVDSIGRDQIDISLMRSNSHIREKLVRLIPTSQGGN
jgi:type IV pilus assembly protein PilX